MNQHENAAYLIEQTVRTLAVGPGDVKSRLGNAFMHNLGYVFEPHVPEDLAPLLTSIRMRLYREPRYDGQSTVESALFGMHKSTASKIANDIFELYVAMSRQGLV